jgi:hypothetical protein
MEHILIISSNIVTWFSIPIDVVKSSRWNPSGGSPQTKSPVRLVLGPLPHGTQVSNMEFISYYTEDQNMGVFGSDVFFWEFHGDFMI